MSWRASLFALVGIAAISWVVSAAELLVLQSGYLQIPPAALVMLVLVAGFNHLRRNPRRRLTSAELTTLYCMFLLAALVSSRGLMEKLISPLVAPHYLDNAGNGWKHNYFPYLPHWAVAFDPSGPTHQFVSTAYYEGLRAGQSLPWMLWLRPMLAWSALIAFVFGAFLCLALLLRRPWVESERLAFPLTSVPLEIIQEAEGRSPLWRQPLMWIGFAVPTFIYSLNSLNAWLPSLPTLPVEFPSLTAWFTSAPWNNLYWTPIFLSYAAFGLLYFVPLDLLFSLAFFFLLSRFQEGILTAFGMEQHDMPMFPCRYFTGYQVMGAYFVLAAGMLRSAWPYWQATWRGVLTPTERKREWVPPRYALLGFCACLLGMGIWSKALGLSFGWAVAQWAIYLLVVCLVMTRSVSEGGVLMTETSFRPVDVYSMFASPHTLGRANLTGMSMLDSVWYRDQRGLVLTGLLDAVKMGSVEGVKPRAFLLCLCGALGLSTVFAAHAQIWLAYHYGALKFYAYLTQGNPVWGYQYYTPFLTTGAPPTARWEAPVFFGVGAGVTSVLLLLRSTFAGWPLLALGYAMSGSWTMILLWFPCLLMWFVKGAILRYGGMKTYRRARPFFLGLILGEFAMAVVWTLASAGAGIAAPHFPWP